MARTRIRVKQTTLWDHMAKNNLSQKELAEKLGITQGYASQLLCGVRHPSPKLRRRILAVLAPLAFDDLFEVEAPESRP